MYYLINIAALLKYTDIKVQKKAVFMTHLTLIQYYILHSAQLASFVILIF